MKNFMEKLKDFLYDATDYLLILAIIIGVGAIIGWRLDILFAKDMDKLNADSENPPVADLIISDEDLQSIDSNNSDSDGEEGTQNNTDEDDSSTNNGETTDGENVNDQEEIVTVVIPSGSLPPTIANILIEKGLIDDKMEFLIRSQELELDTKLKSGEFKIKKGTNLDELIKIIARYN